MKIKVRGEWIDSEMEPIITIMDQATKTNLDEYIKDVPVGEPIIYGEFPDDWGTPAQMQAHFGDPLEDAENFAADDHQAKIARLISLVALRMISDSEPTEAILDSVALAVKHKMQELHDKANAPLPGMAILDTDGNPVDREMQDIIEAIKGQPAPTYSHKQTHSDKIAGDKIVAKNLREKFPGKFDREDDTELADAFEVYRGEHDTEDGFADWYRGDDIHKV